MHSLMFILILSWFAFANLTNNFLTEYRRRICAGEPTCSFVNHQNLPPEKRIFGGRNCLCDSKCKEYQDCCIDSSYYRIKDQLPPFNYFCSPTKNIYMKTSCIPSWTDENIVTKCEKSVLTVEEDLSIIIPLTNVNTGITYGNVYCAVCNNAITEQNSHEFFAWNLTTKCGELPNGVLPVDVFPYSWSFEVPPSVFLDQNQQIVISANFPVFYPDMLNPSKNGYYVMDILLYYVTEEPKRVRRARLPVDIKFNEKQMQLNSSYFYSSRYKRLANLQIDFMKYINEWPLITSNLKYNPFAKLWISKYNNANFVCEFDSIIPEDGLHSRICIPNVISKCLNNDNSIAVHGCQIKTAVVYDIHGNIYRNKDCALCNGISEADIIACPIFKK